MMITFKQIKGKSNRKQFNIHLQQEEDVNFQLFPFLIDDFFRGVWKPANFLQKSASIRLTW